MSAIGEQLISIVRAKAAESPDFRYRSPLGADASCVYVYNGCPSCLLGHALWDAGLIDTSFEHLQTEKYPRPGLSGWANEDGFDEVAEILGLELDPVEQVWLEAAQSAQDDQKTWGRSVELADEAVKEWLDDNPAA